MADTTPTPTVPSQWDTVVEIVRRADLGALDHHLKSAPDLVSTVGPEGRTLLGEAARAATHDHALPSRDAGERHLAVVAHLLAAGADPALSDSNGWTPLHSAGWSGHVELARMLLAAGAPTDATFDDIEGATPLSCALFYAHREAAEVISAAGRSPDDLRSASGLGDLDAMHRGLDGGRPLPAGAAASMAFCGPPEWFPPRTAPLNDQVVIDESLTWAARNGRLEAMELLVAHGADVNANPYRGTPLVWAVYDDCVPAATWLLDHDADPNLRHDFGGAEHGRNATALHLAAQYGALGCVRLLLDRGADATIVDDLHGGTPLGWARFGEQPDAVALLEAHGAR